MPPKKKRSKKTDEDESDSEEDDDVSRCRKKPPKRHDMISSSRETHEGEQKNLAFSVIPVIFRGRATGMKGKCKLEESLRAFIDFQPEGTGLEHYLKKKPTSKAQPYVLLMGGNRTNPTQVFTILERRAIPMPSITKAMDYMFKLIYIFDLNYQPQCFAAWQFMEDIYELPVSLTGSTTTSSSIRDFRSFMETFQV